MYVFRINKLECQYGWVVKAHTLMCFKNSEISSLKIKGTIGGKNYIFQTNSKAFQVGSQYKRDKMEKKTKYKCCTISQTAYILLQEKETGS